MRPIGLEPSSGKSPYWKLSYSVGPENVPLVYTYLFDNKGLVRIEVRCTSRTQAVAENLFDHQTKRVNQRQWTDSQALVEYFPLETGGVFQITRQ